MGVIHWITAPYSAESLSAELKRFFNRWIFTFHHSFILPLLFLKLYPSIVHIFWLWFLIFLSSTNCMACWRVYQYHVIKRRHISRKSIKNGILIDLFVLRICVPCRNPLDMEWRRLAVRRKWIYWREWGCVNGRVQCKWTTGNSVSGFVWSAYSKRLWSYWISPAIWGNFLRITHHYMTGRVKLGQQRDS